MLLCAASFAAGCKQVADDAEPDADVMLRAGSGGVGGKADDVKQEPAAGTGGTGGGTADAAVLEDAGMQDAAVECLEQTAPCEQESECCGDLGCDMTWLGQVCCGKDGASCVTENGEDCCGDLLCVEGQCVPPPTTCGSACLPLTWLADVLRDAGLNVIEDPNWLNHGHGYFTDLWGIMAHHTGGGGTNDWVVVRDGTSSLAGPLSQLVLEKDGTYRVVASGVAWHAGQGSYPGLPTNNANFYTIGIEAVNNGSEGWTDAQYAAYVQGSAAILRFVGHDASRVIGHKEWAGAAQGKWDPGGIEMADFREDVQAAIDQ